MQRPSRSIGECHRERTAGRCCPEVVRHRELGYCAGLELSTSRLAMRLSPTRHKSHAPVPTAGSSCVNDLLTVSRRRHRWNRIIGGPGAVHHRFPERLVGVDRPRVGAVRFMLRDRHHLLLGHCRGAWVGTASMRLIAGVLITLRRRPVAVLDLHQGKDGFWSSHAICDSEPLQFSDRELMQRRSGIGGSQPASHAAALTPPDCSGVGPLLP